MVLATERTDAEHLFGFAVVLVICAGLSDFFDGYIARKQGISSIVGAFWSAGCSSPWSPWTGLRSGSRSSS